jgi:NAD(P)-dependent dehydrogenase (short-subunit alcohol dehydrogenase family)
MTFGFLLLSYSLLFFRPTNMKTNNFDSPVKSVLGWAATGVGVFLVAHAVVKALSKLNLQGKVVLITGGSRGFGLVLARHLADRGAKLAICARSADDLELARQELDARGAKVIAMTVDVSENEEVKAAVRDVIQHYGRLDVLINNAGVIQVGPQDLMGLEEYQVAMQTNFWAQLYAMHAVIPHFIGKGGGRIVNITSIGGKIAIPHLLPYTASKFAAVGLSEGMHAELKKHNITVTTVIPNLMTTGSPRHADIKGNHQKEYAWFKHADANPMLSQNPDKTAERIIEALEYGEAEVTLTLTGKVASLVKGFAPGWVSLLMGVANRFLPDAITGNNVTLKGWQAESALSQGPVSNRSDRAAARNNEM